MKDRNEIKKVDDKNKKEELDYNGNPIDPKREYIGNKVKLPMASPNSSIYKTSATIILRGKPITKKKEKKTKLSEFLSRAPIRFNDNEDE
tara:strand:- start:64 stop:333 length:270 start_codon:yes stop_codon:yes gene_type:complete